MPTEAICPQCQKANAGEAVYCTFCGKRLAIFAGSSEASRPSRAAEWSVLLGLLGILTFGLTAPLGILAGIFALGQIKGSEGRILGWKTAFWGIFISVIVFIFMAMSTIPIFMSARSKANSILCFSNCKQLGNALVMYVEDYDGHFPLKINWCDSLLHFTDTDKLFLCPSTYSSRHDSDYAYNHHMNAASISIQKSPAEIVVIFESISELNYNDNEWNLYGDAELIERRHSGGLNVIFADGHAKWMRRLNQVGWKPENQ